MRIKELFIFIIFLSIANIVNSNDIINPSNNDLSSEREGIENSSNSSGVNCNTELKFCSYIVKNLLNASTLRQRLEEILFPNSAITPDTGFLEVTSTKGLRFWFNDQELLDRAIKTIALVDDYEGFYGSDLVEVSTEIYALTGSALSYIEARLGMVNPLDAGFNWNVSGLIGGGINLNTKVGSGVISAILGAGKVRSNIKQLNRVVQLVPNFSSMDFKKETGIHFSITTGKSGKEVAGISISGKVSISKKDNSLVQIRDYVVRYGVPIIDTGDALTRVMILRHSVPYLYLLDNVTSVLATSVEQVESTEKGGGFLFYDNDKKKSYSKMMILTRVKIYKFDEYIDLIRNQQNRNSLHSEFTTEDIAKLPKRGFADNYLLDKIKLHTFYLPSGERRVLLKIDGIYASQENYKKTVIINVRGGGVSMDRMVEVQHLMLTGILLDPFSEKALSQTHFPIDISSKYFKTKNSSYNNIVKKTFYYNTETNSIITN